MYEIAEEKVGDIRPELEPLLADHYHEVAMNRDRIPLNPDWAQYAELQRLGFFRIFTVREDGEMVGYFAFFVRPNLHYKDHVFAVNDIVYFDPGKRNRRSTIAAFVTIENILKESGVSVVTYHIKTAKDWGGILKRFGYGHAENTYIKFIGA